MRAEMNAIPTTVVTPNNANGSAAVGASRAKNALRVVNRSSALGAECAGVEDVLLARRTEKLSSALGEHDGYGEESND